jgi:GT2 family glycosyltransferase
VLVDDGSTDPYTLSVLAALEARAAADARALLAMVEGTAKATANAVPTSADASRTLADAQPPSADAQSPLLAGGAVSWPVRVHRLRANGYLGAARNAAAQLARGPWLFFMDDDNVAKPQMLALFARAAAASGARVLTCVNHKWPSAERPPQPPLAGLLAPRDADGGQAAAGGVGPLSAAAIDAWSGAGAASADSPERKGGQHWLPIGGCAALGAHANCYGDAHVLIRRDAFQAVGGYTSDYGLGLEDWELYARLTLRHGGQTDALTLHHAQQQRYHAGQQQHHHDQQQHHHHAGQQQHQHAEHRQRAGAEELDGAGRTRRSPIHHLVIPLPLYWYRLSRGGGMLARQHADSPEARAQRLADRLRSLRPYVQSTQLAEEVAEEASAASDGGDGAPWPASARAKPSLEALLLYSDGLRAYDERGALELCANGGTRAWLASIGLVAAVLLVGLRALRRGLQRRLLPRPPRDRSV